MTSMQTVINASEFKATCLELFDRVASGEIERVVITKRGRVVGVLHPPEPAPTPEGVFGCMRGSVLLSAEVDLTAPLDVAFDAERGLLHR